MVALRDDRPSLLGEGAARALHVVEARSKGKGKALSRHLRLFWAWLTYNFTTLVSIASFTVAGFLVGAVVGFTVMGACFVAREVVVGAVKSRRAKST